MASARQVVKEAFESRKYLVAITFVDPKTGILQHRLEMTGFPTEDILNSFEEMKKLAIKSIAPSHGGGPAPAPIGGPGPAVGE